MKKLVTKEQEIVFLEKEYSRYQSNLLEILGDVPMTEEQRDEYYASCELMESVFRKANK